jgi:hypothetical protein
VAWSPAPLQAGPGRPVLRRSHSPPFGVLLQADISDIYLLAKETKGVFVNIALQEPFGLTLIEAAVHGAPIVATRHGGPVDIIGTLKVDYLAPNPMHSPIPSISPSHTGEERKRYRCRPIHTPIVLIFYICSLSLADNKQFTRISLSPQPRRERGLILPLR